jgi:hypothetical protein
MKINKKKIYSFLFWLNHSSILLLLYLLENVKKKKNSSLINYMFELNLKKISVL